jgi:hypothetical protein
MDEVTVVSHLPDGSVEVIVGIPKADVPADLRAGGIDIPNPLLEDELVIYGRAIEPDDEDDRAHAAEMAKRGQVFCECFSVVAPAGEIGTHPLAAVTEISREEFEAARARGWQDG